MAQHERQEITFVGEDDEVALDPRERRGVRLQQWLPDGGGAALAGLVFVLVAWIGASPLVQAFALLFPEGDHSVTPSEGSSFGGGGYYGISPHAVVLVSFGSRALLAAVALGLGLRSRRAERSALSGGCLWAAAFSLGLFLLAAVIMFVGLAHGHSGNFYGVF